MRGLRMTFALLLGGCANAALEPAQLESPVQTGSIGQPLESGGGVRGELRKVQHKGIEDARRPVRTFLAEKGGDCASPRLKEASSKVTDMATALAAGMRADYATMLEAGAVVLEVADGAKLKGCAREARELYDFVLRTFSGLGYAELRQRATVGIRELRGKEQAGAGASSG